MTIAMLLTSATKVISYHFSTVNCYLTSHHDLKSLIISGTAINSCKRSFCYTMNWWGREIWDAACAAAGSPGRARVGSVYLGMKAGELQLQRAGLGSCLGACLGLSVRGYLMPWHHNNYVSVIMELVQVYLYTCFGLTLQAPGTYSISFLSFCLCVLSLPSPLSWFWLG